MARPGNICSICSAQYDAGALFCPRDGAPLGAAAPKGHDPLIGVALLGNVRIEQLIGVGSMGRVYRGFQAGVERSVAVKMLHKELSANPTLVARFRREAQIASRLSHPNVVQALLTGQLPDNGPEAGALYFVMEYLDGISLRSAMAGAGGALPLPRALRIVLQICEAVGAGHRTGVVHRDLKPENVMLLKRESETDFVKVLDFGIARIAGGHSPAVTQAGAVFGTARYVSPEGARGDPVAPPADVYAIATILYQALAGRTPFEGETAVEILGKQIDELPPPIQSIERASYLPDALAAIIMRNLAKHPGSRNLDARDFGLSLLEAARSSGLAPEQLVPRSGLLGPAVEGAAFLSVERTKEQSFTPALAAKIAGQPPSIAPSEAAARVDREWAPSRRNVGLLAFVIGCLAGGAALAALSAYRFHDDLETTDREADVLATDGGPRADGEAR